MKINGREVGFLYTVGAHCEFSEYCIQHPNAPIATAEMYKAVAMNKAYNSANGIEGGLTIEELQGLMMYEWNDIRDEMKRVEKECSTRQVETIEVPGKKGKTVGRSS